MFLFVAPLHYTRFATMNTKINMKPMPPTRKHKNNLHTKHDTLEQSSTKPCWQKPLNFEVGAWGHMGESVYIIGEWPHLMMQGWCKAISNLINGGGWQWPYIQGQVYDQGRSNERWDWQSKVWWTVWLTIEINGWIGASYVGGIVKKEMATA